MGKFRFIRGVITLLPAVLPLVVALMYFTGMVWEGSYYQEFGLNNGVLGSGFSELVVTGFVAWFYTSVEAWSWYVGLSFALLFVFVFLALSYERKWLTYNGGSDYVVGSSANEKGEVPRRLVKLVFGSSVMLFSSALLLVFILFTVILINVTAHLATNSADDKKSKLFISDWPKGESLNRNVWLTDSCAPLTERRQISCSSQTCIFATRSGYEAIPMHNIKIISSSTMKDSLC